MTNEKTLFYVGSEVQKGLFLHEIQGQISDGQWENSRPNDHWQFWCSFDASSIIVDSSKMGRNDNAIINDFKQKYASKYCQCLKDKYNLLDKELLECIGDRMLFMGKLLTAAPAECVKLNHIPDSAGDYKNYERYAIKARSNDGGAEKNCYEKQLEAWDNAGFTHEYLQKIEKDETIFTMKQLKKELSGLRKALASRDLTA